MCYDSSGNFSPTGWDDAASSCVATGKTAHPTIYSELMANNGAAVGLCTKVAVPETSDAAASSTPETAAVSSNVAAQTSMAATSAMVTGVPATSEAATSAAATGQATSTKGSVASSVPAAGTSAAAPASTTKPSGGNAGVSPIAISCSNFIASNEQQTDVSTDEQFTNEMDGCWSGSSYSRVCSWSVVIYESKAFKRPTCTCLSLWMLYIWNIPHSSMLTKLLMRMLVTCAVQLFKGTSTWCYTPGTCHAQKHHRPSLKSCFSTRHRFFSYKVLHARLSGSRAEVVMTFSELESFARVSPSCMNFVPK